GRIRQIVREVLAPHLAVQRRQPGEATFAVALRKIHRMKAPGLLEAMRLRVLVDPAYAGAPVGWSPDTPPADGGAGLERGPGFLGLRQRARAELRQLAERRRELVAQLHAAALALPGLPAAAAAADDHADGELAVTVAYACDRADLRTLLEAVRW